MTFLKYVNAIFIVSSGGWLAISENTYTIHNDSWSDQRLDLLTEQSWNIYLVIGDN